jgi:hypothetical protein
MSAFSAPPPRPAPAPREKICVFFASGTLGKQVVRGLIERGELDARCCVRNAKDPAVVALKNMGGEVIEGVYDVILRCDRKKRSEALTQRRIS